MSDFAQRFGYTKPAVDLTAESMPDTLRAGLWDAIRLHFMSDISRDDGFSGPSYSEDFDIVTDQIWFRFLRKPTDGKSKNPHSALDVLREKVLSVFVFYEVYSFIEFLAGLNFNENEDHGPSLHSKRFIRFCNNVLERERSCFRFVGPSLVMISDQESLLEIEEATLRSEADGVRTHIRSAAQKYSSSPPDYRNSIKEAISAVEAAAFFVTGEKANGLSVPMKKIAETFGIHQGMRKGFEALYGYSSNKDGIRHAILDEERITQVEARYMLVSCAAFANYLVSLKQG